MTASFRSAAEENAVETARKRAARVRRFMRVMRKNRSGGKAINWQAKAS
jgi:hypothetical protein